MKQIIDMNTVKELGIWWYDFNNLNIKYLLDGDNSILTKWEQIDVQKGWLFYYFLQKYPYYQLSNNSLSNSILSQLHQAEQLATSLSLRENKQLSTSSLSYLMDLRTALSYQIQQYYWEDEIKDFPINKDLMHSYKWFQFCKDEKFCIKQEFIINIFNKYCQNWTFNPKKSSRYILVFDKFTNNESNYCWQIIVQASQKFYYDKIAIVLAKNNSYKLHPKDVLFQIFTDYRDLIGIDKISLWKADINFHYHYIERYINFIEPKILTTLFEDKY